MAWCIMELCVMGVYHGCFLVIERLFLSKMYDIMGRFIPMILTFFFVVIGWVFFRVEHFDGAITYIGRMFAMQSGVDLQADMQFITMFCVAIFFIFCGLSENKIYSRNSFCR
jgi:alginate O-acetyltransferase complex protein AlgI